MDGELGQIDTRSNTNNRLYWITHRFYSRHGISPARPLGENTRTMHTVPKLHSRNSTSVEQTPGTANILPRYHSHGPSMAPAPTISGKLPLEKQRQHVDNYPNITRLQNSNHLVVTRRECNARSPLDLPSSGSHDIYRQFGQRLGGHSQQPEHLGEMASEHETQTHQRERVSSSVGNIKTFPVSNSKPQCDGRDGQYLCRLLPQQTGGNQIRFTDGINCETTSMVSGQSHHPPSSTYSRTVERVERPTLSHGSNSQHRVVHSPIHSRPTQPNMGQTTGGLIRHKIQSQTATVLLPNTRPTSLGGGQLITIMEKPDGVCLPPTSNITESTQQNPTRPVYSNSDCPSMELPQLVSHVTQPPGRPAQKNSSKKKVAKTASKQYLPSVTCTTQLTRMETVRRHLANKGFSKATAHCISHRCKKATNNLYEARWRIYTRWCRKRKIDPINITTPQLADFLHYLDKDLKRGLSAIQGFRAVINTTIQMCKNQEPANNVYINSLMRSIKISQPIKDSQIPKWNLNLVLNSLTKPPYEPMLSASLKHITWKTTFLVAFATAARVSELRALDSRKVAHTEDWSKVILQTHPSFVAKNQDLAHDNQPRKYTIPALFDFAGPDLPDRLLCPVRSLRYYLQKVKPLRTKHKRGLFISFDARHTGEITANTIAGWIKNVIREAYHNANEELCDLSRISAHEVRALGASAAYQKNLSLDTINNACYWRGHSTFTTYYLRDISLHSNGEMTLPNMVAASCRIVQ